MLIYIAHRRRKTSNAFNPICQMSVTPLPPLGGLAASEMWGSSGGRKILTELSLSYSIVYHHNGAQCYDQFLQVGRLYWDLILLGLAVCLPSTSCLQSSKCYIYFHFWLHSLLCLLVSWTWRDCPLTWSTNQCPSVLWHCWLGHMTSEIVPEVTYNA